MNNISLVFAKMRKMWFRTNLLRRKRQKSIANSFPKTIPITMPTGAGFLILLSNPDITENARTALTSCRAIRPSIIWPCMLCNSPLVVSADITRMVLDKVNARPK
jgi:hypothetical protein